jgi:hypothetical protein
VLWQPRWGCVAVAPSANMRAGDMWLAACVVAPPMLSWHACTTECSDDALQAGSKTYARGGGSWGCGRGNVVVVAPSNNAQRHPAVAPRCPSTCQESAHGYGCRVGAVSTMLLGSAPLAASRPCHLVRATPAHAAWLLEAPHVLGRLLCVAGARYSMVKWGWRRACDNANARAVPGCVLLDPCDVCMVTWCCGMT